MNFSYLIKIISAVTIIFGIYLLCYGAFCLWQYQGVLIPEAVEKDAHGMSRLVGYTFILMLGIAVSAFGLFVFMIRNVMDSFVQNSILSGLFVAYALTFLSALYLQIYYWGIAWGRLYVAAFLFLAFMSGYFRFFGRRAS